MAPEFENDVSLLSAFGEALDSEHVYFPDPHRTNFPNSRTMLCLGRRLLVGNGMDANPEEGVALVSSAAERGLAEAQNLLATLTGAGAWTEQSWPRALDLLQAAAEGGSRDAREQILLLATDAKAVTAARTGTRDKALWRALRQSIDLEKFVRPPQPQPMCEAPRIWRADNFASPQECRRLIDRTRGKLQPAKMYDRAQRTVQFNAIRTNSEYFFDIVHSGIVLVLMRIRIGLLVSLPVPHMEPPQMLHYAPGQVLRAHYDFLRDGETPIAAGYDGDRVVTFLLYLNEEYEGGETEFSKVGFRHKGRAGDAMFFANLRGGKPDPLTLHAGTTVRQGEKWLFSQWIHDRPFAVA